MTTDRQRIIALRTALLAAARELEGLARVLDASRMLPRTADAARRSAEHYRQAAVRG